MSARIRMGLAGYGLGGRSYHAPLIASAENCEFLGVVTTSPERRLQAGKDLGRPVFASLADLASAGAEAVAISTPADTHVGLTEQALRLGLAVVCDKPFAPDADSARQVVQLSEQLKLPLTVYQNRRWVSDFRTVRKLLDQGSLGALGPVTGVYAEVHHRAGPARLDDDVFVALTHESGVRSHLLQVPCAAGRWHGLGGLATLEVAHYPAFAAAVRGTQPMPVDPWDAVATVAVLDAARVSARTAQVVSPAPAA